MRGERHSGQSALFYAFDLERHVPADHLLRGIDQVIELESIRTYLKPYYSETGRPSICPELMIRMLLVGYCLGIRSERRLCEEVHLNLAYRWFCRLGLEGDVPHHSTFSKNRHGRFRESDVFRHVFDQVLRRCMAAGLVGGEAFAVDGSLIQADADRRKGPAGEAGLPADKTSRAIEEYLAVLDDAAFGGASPKQPRYISTTDPASRWTSAHGGPAFYAYEINYLIDTEHAVIVDVEPTTAIRQAEYVAAKRMLARAEERHGLAPERLAADTAYGSSEMLQWLVEGQGIEPHIPVFDRGERNDGTFSRSDFVFDLEADEYTCPTGKKLKQFNRLFKIQRSGITKDGNRRYRASKKDCSVCPLKEQCCPRRKMRIVSRSIHERARDRAREIAKTEAYVKSRRERKKVEMLFAHLKRILRLGQLRLRGPNGARDEFTLAATAQNLRRLAKLIPAAA